MRRAPLAGERRHTLYFQREIRSIAPVFLDTEVDMSRVCEHRARYAAVGRRYSTVTYLLHTAARVLARHPEANAAIRGRYRPKVAYYDTVNGKVAFDKTLNGHRIVLSTVFPGVDRATMDDIQRHVEHCRDGDPAVLPEFAGARILHRLPWPLGPAALYAGIRPLERRPAAVGTFSISSLGHRPVDAFHSVGGTTITLGLGRIADRPVVRDGELSIAPVMRLSLAFDHRVVDGAEAADVLSDIKDGLERFAELEVPA